MHILRQAIDSGKQTFPNRVITYCHSRTSKESTGNHYLIQVRDTHILSEVGVTEHTHTTWHAATLAQAYIHTHICMYLTNLLYMLAYYVQWNLYNPTLCEQ
jgi:ABC-type arginine transport system permease subunit